MPCSRFSTNFTIIRLSIDSCFLIVAIMILQVNSAILGEDGSTSISSDETTNKAVYSILWLYAYPMLARNIIGWIGISTTHVIYLFLYQILTGVILFMHTVTAIYGLAKDHEAVLAVIVICFIIEIPTFVTAINIVNRQKASIRGKEVWISVFGDDIHLDLARRSTIA